MSHNKNNIRNKTANNPINNTSIFKQYFVYFRDKCRENKW